MQLPVTNRHNISLEMAVWLLYDEYDYIDQPNAISATALMKPLRQIVLGPRLLQEQKTSLDLEDLIALSMGNALHAGIEKAWKNREHVFRALTRLGVASETASKVLSNPTEQELQQEGVVPVYVEQRSFRTVEVRGESFVIHGKFDLLPDGMVTDVKSTSVWSYIYGNRNKEYQLQGSIYRWLNREKVTHDVMRVNYIFTDWNKNDAARKPDYPQCRIKSQEIPLLSLEDTELWIKEKLALVLQYKDKPEAEIPECTEEELWMSPSKFKYYANPQNAMGGLAKSTRNFDTQAEADAYMKEKGKGTVITVPGTPRRCTYCPVFNICTQKDKYNHD